MEIFALIFVLLFVGGYFLYLIGYILFIGLGIALSAFFIISYLWEFIAGLIVLGILLTVIGAINTDPILALKIVAVIVAIASFLIVAAYLEEEEEPYRAIGGFYFLILIITFLASIDSSNRYAFNLWLIFTILANCLIIIHYKIIKPMINEKE